MISAIVAVDENWGIGYQGQLLEHIPADLKHFKELTKYNVVVMGRNTWESLPKKDALPRLPDRINIIVSNSMVSNGVISILGDLTVAMPLEGTLDYIKACDMDIFVIGGETIYRQLLPLCDTVFVTKIDAVFEADSHFPNLDQDPNYELVWTSKARNEGGIGYKFTEYKKVENENQEQQRKIKIWKEQLSSKT